MADLATTKEGKEALKKRNWKEVVVYDDSSEDLSSLPYSHTLFLVINSLLEDGRQPIMLIGGLRAFQVFLVQIMNARVFGYLRESVFNMHIWPLCRQPHLLVHTNFYTPHSQHFQISQVIFFSSSDNAVITVRRSLDETEPLPKPQRPRSPRPPLPH